MNIVIIQPSKNKLIKFDAIINGERTVSFGARGFEDYTIHGDDIRKARYISRHQTREDWGDPTTAGALSRWLLWNKKTLQTSIDDMNKRFRSKGYLFILRK